MSDFQVLSRVSRELRSMLRGQFVGTNLESLMEGNDQSIVFTNPSETRSTGVGSLSLWMFRIEENEFTKNQPLRRPAPNGKVEALEYPALALELSYLVTPFTGSADLDLELLGRTMQILSSESVVSLANEAEDVYEELKIILSRISLEEMTRIWEALNEPYRLSVCYRVRVVRIDSRRRQLAAPVTDSRRAYAQSDGSVQ